MNLIEKIIREVNVLKRKIRNIEASENTLATAHIADVANPHAVTIEQTSNDIVGQVSGNIGISQPAPSTLLHLGDATTVDGELTLESTGGRIIILKANDAGDFCRIGTSSNHDFRIIANDTTVIAAKSTGKVGIGEGTPGALLDTQEDADSNLVVAMFGNKNTGSSTQARIQITRGADSGTGTARGLSVFSGVNASGLAEYEAKPLDFFTGASAGSATRRIRITTAGDVGISQDTPLTLLHIGDTGGSDGELTLESSGGRIIIIKANDSGDYLHLGSSTDHNFTFVRNDTKYLVLDSSRCRVYDSGGTEVGGITLGGAVYGTDGMTAPSALSGLWQTYVDTSDGNYKIKFADGTVKTLATNP